MGGAVSEINLCLNIWRIDPLIPLIELIASYRFFTSPQWRVGLQSLRLFGSGVCVKILDMMEERAHISYNSRSV